MSRIVRGVIVAGVFLCTLVLAQNVGQVWRITLKDERECLVSFDVATSLRPAHVREAVQKHLESQW